MKTFAKRSKKAFSGRLSITTNLPMASASAVVVESTSVWLGLTKTLYAWMDSSL